MFTAISANRRFSPNFAVEVYNIWKGDPYGLEWNAFEVEGISVPFD
jgi:hypothetical protein